MAYVPLSRFLFRAPLLPSQKNAPADLWGHPLGGDAIRMASPELAAALNRASKERAETPKAATKVATKATKPKTAKGMKGDSSRDSKGAAADLALARYSRRAAFRSTPSGLLAGVGLGQLGRSLRVATAQPRATGGIAWPRLQSLARALLADAGLRSQTRLRLGPSVIVSGDKVIWLGSAGANGFVMETRSAIDEVVGAVLEIASAWTPWISVRAAVMATLRHDTGDDERDAEKQREDDQKNDDDADDEMVAESVDDVLLTMLDDGFLHCDLVPPLIGPRPGAWMQQRLSRVTGALESGEVEGVSEGDLGELRARLTAASAEAAHGHFEAASAILASLPDHPHPAGRAEGTRRLIDAVLRFDDSPHVTLPANVVSRAGALAPILFRLQEALTPPVRERAPAPAVAEALDAASEIFGAGAFDLRALATGEYGVSARPEPGPSDDRDEDDGDGNLDPRDEDAAGASLPPLPLLTLLMDKIAAAARAAEVEIQLTAEELDAVLPAADAPASCELFLTPRAKIDVEPRTPLAKGAARPGSGWLLGLHAPAGSSWGRFAHSLSDEEQAQLFGPLVAAERQARPGEACLDVAFAPDAQLADLCAHPPFRAGALAITHWPAERPEGHGVQEGVVTAVDLELVAEPSAREPLALRHGALPVAPSPLHRVRSTTAPPGIWRLLTGWSLCRQHRPWTMLWGPLADLEFLPRVQLDGFVIAPASWRVPADLVRDLAAPSADSMLPSPARHRFSAWRRQSALPRHVQVGREDELLPVDLDSPAATGDLRGHDRVFEIWPPLGDTPDEQGRRVEAVIALVDHPDDGQRARLESDWARVSGAGPVPPPHLRQPGEDGAGWATLKLFGLAEAQNAVLVEIVAPAVAAARQAKDLSRWFFQRYVDPPGRRPHLRVRVQGDAERLTAHIEVELERTFARARGQIVSIERTPYFPESARYGGRTALPAIHRLFEAESDLICACLGGPDPAAGDSAGESTVGSDAPDAADSVLFHVVRAFDNLTRGLGWNATARQNLAARRRHAHADEVDDSIAEAWAAAYRRAKPRLRAMLLDEGPWELRDAFAAYHRDLVEIASALAAKDRDDIMASLLHVSAVRWLGADRMREIQAYTFWERTLESLSHHRPKPRAKV